MNRTLLVVLGGALIFVVAAAWWWMEQAGRDDVAVQIDPNDAELVAIGERIYAQQCASCHGVGLEGQADWRQRKADGRMPAPPHDATGHTWHHDDATLFTVTKFGLQAVAGPDYESDMPAYSEVLSDREILAVLAYIKSTWPAEVRDRQAAISQRAKGNGS